MVENGLPAWENPLTKFPQPGDDVFGEHGTPDPFEQDTSSLQLSLLTRFGVIRYRSSRVASWARIVGDWLFTVGGGYDTGLDFDAASAAEEGRAGIVGPDEGDDDDKPQSDTEVENGW
jgi:hypothetical protein